MGHGEAWGFIPRAVEGLCLGKQQKQIYSEEKEMDRDKSRLEHSSLEAIMGSSSGCIFDQGNSCGMERISGGESYWEINLRDVLGGGVGRHPG